MRRYKPICTRCGEIYSAKELNAGFHLCHTCRVGAMPKHRFATKPASLDWGNDKHVLNWAQEKMA